MPFTSCAFCGVFSHEVCAIFFGTSSVIVISWWDFCRGDAVRDLRIKLKSTNCHKLCTFLIELNERKKIDIWYVFDLIRPTNQPAVIY